MFSTSKKCAVREILPPATKPIQMNVNPMTSSASKRGKRSKKQGVGVAPVSKPAAAKLAPPYRKKKISGALREAVWMKTMGRVFEGKCPVVWCSNTITVFDFQSGHNIPESKGGETKLPNLIPICSRCNFSMGNTYTIDEWNALHASPPSDSPVATEQVMPSPPRSFWRRMFGCCFSHL